MTTPTHLAAGILIGHVSFQYFGIPSELFPLWLATSIISANAPDIDGILKIKNLISHRDKSYFHFPIIWLLCFLILFLLARITSNTWLMPWMILVVVNVGFHFIFDTFGYVVGIRWLAPLSTKEYSFFRLYPRPDTMWKAIPGYFKNKIFFIEFLIILSIRLVYRSLY